MIRAIKIIPFVYEVYTNLAFRLSEYKVKLVSVVEIQKIYKIGENSFSLGLAHFDG